VGRLDRFGGVRGDGADSVARVVRVSPRQLLERIAQDTATLAYLDGGQIKAMYVSPQMSLLLNPPTEWGMVGYMMTPFQSFPLLIDGSLSPNAYRFE
jgi:hypothetical protein